MKAIDVAHAEIGSVSSRVDGSIRFNVITPELTLEQRATVLGLHGKNVRVMVEPLDVQIEGLDKVTTEMNVKTPCQRLHSVIYVHWKQAYPDGTETFDNFYRSRMDKIIEGYKDKNLKE